jgi:tetratricopeptide (TPR) repeat protein
MNNADNSNPKPKPKDSETMRREAVEISKRRHRGLPAYRGNNVPIHAEADPETAAKALSEGRVLFKEKKFAAAMLKADTVRGRAPVGSDLWAEGMVLRAEVYMEQGAIQSARDTLRRVLHQNEGYVPARLLMGESYRRVGMYPKAIELLLDAIPLLPDPAERTQWQKVLADTYISNGQPALARKVLKVAEKPEALGWETRLKTAAALLLPATPLAWVLLIAVFLISLFAIANFSAPINVLIVLGSVGLYGTLQWVLVPKTKT